jgi:tetratricopeptide (TPR) repeat protein
MANSKYEAGIAWYKEMTRKYPKNYQLIFGYANILYNNSIYEEAISNYEIAAKLKPSFVKPLVDLALLYEYRRIQKRKSTEKAK